MNDIHPSSDTIRDRVRQVYYCENDVECGLGEGSSGPC